MKQPNLYLERTKSASTISLERGKIPPQAVDLEEAILGAMMIDKKGLEEIIDIVSPEFFYREDHRLIFESIQQLFNGSQPIDLFTVANQLKNNGTLEAVGGDFYLVQLTQKVTSSAHIEYHSRIVQQKYILRKLIEISSQIIDKSYDETNDVFDLLDEAENKLFEITNGNLKKSFQTAQSLVKEAIENIKSIAAKQGLSGVASGFKKIDQITSGWQNSDLIILAARPGMGKTAFVLSMIKNIVLNATNKVPVALFSLEMSSVQLITRLISSETGIKADQLKKGQLADHEWTQLYAKVKSLEDAPLYIDDTPALSIFDLRAKCRRLVSQNKVGMVVIDYLQLMTAGNNSGGNREQEISAISRSLKAIAKELNIPIIALSQLSRAVETRGGTKRPLLSDLRESGAIEQDADIVTFIYRPDYYGLEVWDDDQASPCVGEAEFIIAKHRNGALDNIRLRFIKDQATFTNLEENNFIGNNNSFQIQSKMNVDSANDDSWLNQIKTIDPKDSFGINDEDFNEDNGMPF
ncbi:MAG: replicative DNA helicase [Solirubrobacteraceae bacterium]